MAQLAAKLGVTMATVSDYERGKSTPSYSVLEKLADVFDCKVDYLMGRDGKTPVVSEESLGARISRLRLNIRMSQADLAERMGCTVQTVGNWEGGRRLPDNQTSMELCRVFGIDPNYLFGWNSSPNVPEWLAPWWRLLPELDEAGRSLIIAALRVAAPRVVDYDPEPNPPD